MQKFQLSVFKICSNCPVSKMELYLYGKSYFLSSGICRIREQV